MKLSLLVTALLLGATSAQAATTVLAECRGSVLKDNAGEMYSVLLKTNESSGASEIAVEARHNKGLSIQFPVSKQTVKINSAETLVASAEVERRGTADDKKFVGIDFKTGTGKATSVSAWDMFTKERVIYLSYCTR